MAPAGSVGGPWWSNRRAEPAIFAAMVLLLELLPLQAALLTLTAASGSPLGAEPISPLINAVLLLGMWSAGAILRGTPAPLAIAAAAPCFAAACALALLTSPSAYAGSGNAAGALLADLSGATPRVGADIGVLLVAIFIGWRGFATGSAPPSSGSVSLRFKLGLGVLLAAIAVAALVHTPQQGPLLGALAVLLPVEVYCGLIASALARIQRERLRSGVMVAPGIEGNWLGMALGLAGVIVGGTLALSLVVSYRNVGALLARLGPIGSALNALASGVGALVGLIAYALFNWLFQLLAAHGWRVNFPKSTSQPASRCPPGTPIATCMGLKLNTLDPFWLHIGILVLQIGTMLAVVIIGLLLLRRLIAGRRRFAAALANVEEERESLDVSSLLGAQLRALLAGLRRPSPARDPLTPGTIRYLYRGVLRAAAGADLTRAPSETPDEFAGRAAMEVPVASGEQSTMHDMTALTEAYDAARYAEREPEEGSLGALRQAAQRMTDALRRLRRR